MPFRSGLFRNHPLLVASTAASGGVLLGAYVAFQIFAPVDPGAKAALPQPVVEAKAVPETTGSSSPKDDVAAADSCEGQTWPYLSRECTEQMRSRNARTVSTDRVEKPAPEAQQAPQAPQPPTNSAAAPAPAPSASSTAVAPAPAAPAISAVDPPAPAAQPANNQTAAAPPQAVEPVVAPSDAPSKVEKRKVKEAKRKAKKPKSEEFDDRALAYAPNDDVGDEQADRGERRSLRTEGRESRSDRMRRERVIVRDDEGDRVSERGERRVIVIQRDSESGGGLGGIFGNLFRD